MQKSSKKEKRHLKKFTQTQQNKLLLQARGGAAPKKNVQKQPQKQIEDEDFISYEQQHEQNENDDSINEVREKPLKKQVRKRVVKIQKTPQINYTNPQIDLEELIKLRTENSFIKQQHQDAIKQIEKYKLKAKRNKQTKQIVEKEEPQQIQQEPQQIIHEQPQEEQQQEYNDFDLY